MTPDATAEFRPRRTIGLFAGLFALGSLYLASLGYFLAHGKNFVDQEKFAAATRFAQSTRLALPATLHFGRQSAWSHSLSTGWNFPESWGVWSDRREADIVLPAIRNAPGAPVCFSIRLGAMKSTRHWPMTVTVNGHTLAARQDFTGTGPFIVQGTAKVPRGSLIHLQFLGPEPEIPNLVSRHSSDPRSLGFSLFQVSLAARCGHP